MGVDFSKGEGALQLNGLLNSDDGHGLLEQAGHRSICRMFRFFCALLEKETAYTNGWRAEESKRVIL